jgi:hypothetical protein
MATEQLTYIEDNEIEYVRAEAEVKLQSTVSRPV